MSELSKLCIELLLQIGDDVAHDLFDLLLVKRFAGILQDTVYGVALFTCWQIFAFVDIKEFDALEEFTFALLDNSLYLCKISSGIYQER